MRNKADRLLGGKGVTSRKGELRKSDLGDGKDASEKQIGGGQIPQENPRGDFTAEWPGPDGLVESFKILGIERIGDPSGTAGDEVEGDGSSGGSKQQGGETLLGEGFANEENGEQCEARACEIHWVRRVADAQRESHRPHAERNRKPSPTGGEQGTTEKQGDEGLKIRLGLGKRASQYTKCDDESDDEAEWEIAVHDGRRIVDFLKRG